MIQNFPALKHKSSESGVISSSWVNNGAFCFVLEDGSDMGLHVTVLPSEMKAILEHGDYEGKTGRRPCLGLTVIGRTTSRAGGDLITVTQERDLGYGVRRTHLTLKKHEWQEMFDACVAERDGTVTEWGGMIEPIGGKSNFTEESKVT